MQTVALTDYQQAYGFIGNAKNILVASGHRQADDSYPACVAFTAALNKIGKLTTLFSKENAPENLSFLNNYFDHGKTKLTNSISGARDLVLSIDVSQKPVKSISYKKQESWLNISIIPHEGVSVNENDVHIGLSGFNYDLVIAVGLDDFESLGEEFQKNATLFFETPVINIDKNSSNERYGEVNLIEPLSSSCSEIMANFLKNWDETLIDKNVATLLLAGLVSSTNNFQNEKTKPNTLLAAAYLMSKDADQQEIVRNLFKTKSFEFLKLLGAAMAKFQYDNDRRLGWFSLSEDDFNKTGATYKILPSIIAELKNSLGESSCIAAFWETQKGYFCIVNPGSEKQAHSAHKEIGGQTRGNNIIMNAGKPGSPAQNNIIRKLQNLLDKT